VRHGIEKISRRATALVQTSLQSEVGAGRYELPKSRDSNPRLQPGIVSGLLLGSPGKKNHLDVASIESCRKYNMGEGGGFPRVRAVVSQVSPSARGLFQHPRVFPNVN